MLPKKGNSLFGELARAAGFLPQQPDDKLEVRTVNEKTRPTQFSETIPTLANESETANISHDTVDIEIPENGEQELQQAALLKRAITETTRSPKYQQESRVGKQLLGAYIDKKAVAQLKSLLALRGQTFQEYLEKVVAQELATDLPEQREALRREAIEQHVQRYRQKLEADLK